MSEGGTFSASEVATFVRALQRFGVTCAEAAERFRMPDGPEIIDDQPEWYEDANPWDAHTVSFGDTLERIDQALELHQDRPPIDVDEILTSLGPEFDDIPDSPYGSAYTPEEWPAVLSAFRGIRYRAVPRPLSEFRRIDGGGVA